VGFEGVAPRAGRYRRKFLNPLSEIVFRELQMVTTGRHEEF